MDNDAKKTALRMLPYGLYVLTAASKDGSKLAAATVNWVTQASFAPPLVAVGLAFAFFKPSTVEGNKISGETFAPGSVVKAPVLDTAPAHVECRVVETVKKGDHTLFVAEVVEARVKTAPTGRADDAICWLKDLGEKVYYGG